MLGQKSGEVNIKAWGSPPFCASSAYRKATDSENIRKGSMTKTTAAGEVNHRGKVRRQGSVATENSMRTITAKARHGKEVSSCKPQTAHESLLKTHK